MPEAWVKHCTEVWVQNTRPSELKSDCISNPNDRSDDAVYHTHYLEMRVSDMHDLVVKSGQDKFGDEYHWSEKYTRAARPFFVKNATARFCLCYIHLRFKFMVVALYEYMKQLRKNGQQACCCLVE